MSTTQEQTTRTANLTQDQVNTIERLRKTTMAGEVSDTPKSFQEMFYSIVEAGIAAKQQQRKQYARVRAAVKAYNGR